MLSFETKDNWTLSLTVSVAAAPSTFNATKTSACGVMLEFLTWLNHAARPWFGTRTFDWHATRNGDSAIEFTITCTGTFFLDAVAGSCVTRLGFVAGGPYTQTTGTGATGTAAPQRWVLRSADPSPKSHGDTSAQGSVSRDNTSTCAIRPIVECAETKFDNARRESVLNDCTNPRAAYLSDQNYNSAAHVVTSSGWNRYNIGAITPTRKSGILWRTQIEAYR